MFEQLAEWVSRGGPLMFVFLMLGCLSPFVALATYVLGLVMKNKAWALRFAIVNIAVGTVVPLVAWAFATARTHSIIEGARGSVAPQDLGALDLAAHADGLELLVCALLGAPWLLLSGFALLGVAMLRHASLATQVPPSPPAPGAPPPAGTQPTAG